MTASPSLPLVLEPKELEALLPGNDLLIIDLCNPQLYARMHIPGAIHVSPQALVADTPPAPGKLPSKEQLESLFSSLGYTGKEHIVVYDDEGGGWAGRFIWTLDIIGHTRYSYLNGGMHAWVNEGHSTDNQPVQREPVAVNLTLDESPRASLEYVLDHFENHEVAIWDARSPAEYHGEKVLAMKGGHIPGAINFEWTLGMDPAQTL